MRRATSFGLEALEAIVDGDEFRHWSARSLQETVAAIDARCDRSRACHRRLASLCVCRALACIPRASIVAWSRATSSS